MAESPRTAQPQRNRDERGWRAGSKGHQPSWGAPASPRPTTVWDSLAQVRYLDSGFGQVDLQGDFLPHEDVGVAGLGEKCLQHVQLRAGEGGALPPLLPWGGWGQAPPRQSRWVPIHLLHTPGTAGAPAPLGQGPGKHPPHAPQLQRCSPHTPAPQQLPRPDPVVLQAG